MQPILFVLRSCEHSTSKLDFAEDCPRTLILHADSLVAVAGCGPFDRVMQV